MQVSTSEATDRYCNQDGCNLLLRSGWLRASGSKTIMFQHALCLKIDQGLHTHCPAVLSMH